MHCREQLQTLSSILHCMGNCASSKDLSTAMATAKVIHVDGTVEEFKGAVNAGEVAARSPGCFVCSIEAMAIGASAPCVPETEELKLGELYFLMPGSRLRYPLSLHDLCVLAVTASAALCQKTKGRRLKR